MAGRSRARPTCRRPAPPDAYWGAPLRGLDDLAARLVRPASVAEAITALPLPGVELLHALAALGPRPTVADAAALLDRGDRSPRAQRDAVRGALVLLEHSALAWLAVRDGPDGRDVIELNPGVRVVIDLPLGIGRTVAGHLEHTTPNSSGSCCETSGCRTVLVGRMPLHTFDQFLTDRNCCGS